MEILTKADNLSVASQKCVLYSKNLGCNFGKQKLYFLYLVESLNIQFKYKTYFALFMESALMLLL